MNKYYSKIYKYRVLWEYIEGLYNLVCWVREGFFKGMGFWNVLIRGILMKGYEGDCECV